jgi:hypothetical protein
MSFTYHDNTAAETKTKLGKLKQKHTSLGNINVITSEVLTTVQTYDLGSVPQWRNYEFRL